MPRFVILEHDYPELHWDFMLEDGLVLKTWRLARVPKQGEETIEAVALPDHRVGYLDYEGPISGGRGTVKRWDGGPYEIVEQAGSERIKIRLLGAKARGTAILKENCSKWVFRLD